MVNVQAEACFSFCLEVEQVLPQFHFTNAIRQLCQCRRYKSTKRNPNRRRMSKKATGTNAKIDSTDDEVLVAILRDKHDAHLLHDQGWYRTICP